MTSARRSLLFAGGIGVTPMLAMAEALWECNAEFVLHYGACTRSGMAFAKRLATAGFAEGVALYLDDEPATRLDLAAAIGIPENDTHIYACGPKGFINAVMEAARGAGCRRRSCTSNCSAPRSSHAPGMAVSMSNWRSRVAESSSRPIRMWPKPLMLLVSRSRCPANRESAAPASPAFSAASLTAAIYL